MSEFSKRTYRLIFSAAAGYNILFGLWAAAFPRAFFDLFALAPPRYPAIWACLGMVVGLYGAGYAYAAWRLDRAFPFIAIGLAGKVLGPIGWIIAVHSGELPARTFPLIVFDDLLWWTPFALFLLEGTAVTRFLKRTAPHWCAALHIAAAAGTVLILRSMCITCANMCITCVNMRYAWLLWMAAAISLAGFYAWWSARAGRLLPFAFGAAGLFFDFAGESIFVGWAPATGTPLYRAADLLTGAAGNGLYTVAAIMLTLVTPSLPLRALAWIAWASGIALAIATVLDLRTAAVASTVTLMAAFVPFVLGMARR